MSSKKRRTAEHTISAPLAPPVIPAALGDAVGPRRRIAWWVYAIGMLVTALIGFEVYGPALRGEFLFDDSYLPFMMPEVQNAPLTSWLGVRPLLMVSYWWNYRNWGLDPYPYHVVGVLFHVLNSWLAWVIVRRLLAMVGEHGWHREVLALFAGGLFLLHPAQTESVAYVTSRSETMSVFFFLAAYALFLCRPEGTITVGRALAVIVLFGSACTVKEHTTVLPGLLLLTDYYFTTPFRFEGIKRNFKLYIPIALGALLGLVAVWKVLSSAQTAGFKAVKEFTWYQYLFTQFRVIWTYVRLYLLPAGQNGDYDYPISRTIFEYGAIVGLAALLAACWLAWKYRREWALASFGFFAFLLLLAPTSSVVPIRDVIVERRMYLPFVCLLIVTVDILRRWRTNPGTLAAAGAAILIAAGAATYNRNHVWSSALAFWQDTVEKSPANPRAQFQLAYAQWQAGNCLAAVGGYEKAAKLQKVDDRLLVDWALALDCADRPDEALEKLKQAAAIAPSALIWAQIGMIHGKRGRDEEAMAALDQAESLDPRFDMIYVYRGNIFASRGDYATAAGYYRHALAINPANDTAKRALALSERKIAESR